MMIQLTFSIGSNIILNEKEIMKKYNGNKNKEINFKLKSDIEIDKIKELLKNEKVTVDISFYDNCQNTIISTQIVSNSFDIINDMKSGKKFNKDDYNAKDNRALISSALEDKSLNCYGNGSEAIDLENKGVFFDFGKKVNVANNTFKKLLSEDIINTPVLRVIISGEEKDLHQVINLIEIYIKQIDGENSIEIFDYIRANREVETRELYKASIMIVVITIINSIILSSLWIDERVKEIALRKALGATNGDIFKIFFGEILKVAIIALIISNVLELSMIYITGGYIQNININYNIKSLIYTSILSVLTVFIVTIPSIRYLSKVEPAKLLKGE